MCTFADSGDSARFESETFSKRAQLIKKYVENDADLQLRVLYALQIAVTQLRHPPGELSLCIIIQKLQHITRFEISLFQSCIRSSLSEYAINLILGIFSSTSVALCLQYVQ